MKNGCLEQEGTPREIYQQPASHHVADFFGTCNFLPLSVFPAARRVPFVTSSTCTATDARARELVVRTGGAVESMEGAAVVHVALLEGKPVGEIRGISNPVGPRDRSTWRVREAAEAAQRVLIEWLEC